PPASPDRAPGTIRCRLSLLLTRRRPTPTVHGHRLSQAPRSDLSPRLRSPRGRPFRRKGSCLMRAISRWLAAILLLFPIAALAQETTGRLDGRLVDAKGSPIAFANVIVSSPALQGMRGGQSAEDGRFVLLALPIGEYTLRISHPAYRAQLLAGVHVLLGQETHLGVVKLEEQVSDVK